MSVYFCRVFFPFCLKLHHGSQECKQGWWQVEKGATYEDRATSLHMGQSVPHHLKIRLLHSSSKNSYVNPLTPVTDPDTATNLIPEPLYCWISTTGFVQLPLSDLKQWCSPTKKKKKSHYPLACLSQGERSTCIEILCTGGIIFPWLSVFKRLSKDLVFTTFSSLKED